MKNLKYMAVGVLSLLSVGCSRQMQDDLAATGNAGKLTVYFETAALSAAQTNETAPTDEALISEVKGYHFENGLLREVLVGDNQMEDGAYAFYPSSTSGDIFFVTNDAENLFGQVTAEITTLDEFLRIEGTTTSMASTQIMMTGSIALTSATSAPTVSLRRSVARLDLVSPDSGISVHSVTIRGIADRGYVFGQTVPSSPASAQWGELTKAYPDPGVENHTETLAYLSEQAGTALTAEVIASFGGGLHRMVAEFPSEILRNRIYTLRIYGSGAQASVRVEGSDWESGSSTDATQNAAVLIATESSILPEGVTVSPSRDSVFIPYKGAAVELAIQTEPGAEVRVDGTTYLTTVTVGAASRALETSTTVTIDSQNRIPGYKRSYIYLNSYLEGKYRGRVVLVFEPNPAQITGTLVLDTNGVCDFGKYIDGELGRIILPEGKTATVEFDADEARWAKVVQENGEFRFLGGWRPNDQTADGRTQSCRLVIANADGSDRETYEIRRKNWGLPVVKFGENWWCKYNLRGNSKSFEDQITIQEDPVSDGSSLAEYLQTCDTAQLRRLLGDQYQGGYPNGLKLSVNDTKYYYAGMRGSAQNFGSIDATSMTPDGYQIPDKEDFSAFGASTNHNLGGVGNRGFLNTQKQQVNLTISQRTDVMLLEQNYGTMNFYEFATTRDGACVLYGLGHQWSTTQGDVSKLSILFATSGVNGNSWGMEGSASGNNFWKFAAQNSTKTRTIRCIKTPVEYIY